MTASLLPLSVLGGCVLAYGVAVTPADTYARALPVVVLWREDEREADPDGNGQAGAQYPWHEVEPSAGSWTAEREATPPQATPPAKRPRGYAPDRAAVPVDCPPAPDYVSAMYAPALTP